MISSRLTDLKEKMSKQEKEQKALPAAISKAIKDSVEKAQGNALETLGQVVVFSTLMDGVNRAPNDGYEGNNASPNKFRLAAPENKPVLDILRSLGLSLRHAKALELTGDPAFSTGLFLVIEGTAARLATTAWAGKNAKGSMVMECGIGVTDDTTTREIVADEARSITILPTAVGN